MAQVALEEYLLLAAYRQLLQAQDSPADYPPMLTMSSRNAIVAQAILTLWGPYKADFLQYADRLSASIGDTVYVNFSPPPRNIGNASPAEICATNNLARAS